MNERLKELYRQAHGTRHYDGDPALDGNPPTVYWQGETSAQRFAELIVRECINICNDIADPHLYRNQDILQRMNPGASYAAKVIKLHFGVEE